MDKLATLRVAVTKLPYVTMCLIGIGMVSLFLQFSPVYAQSTPTDGDAAENTGGDTIVNRKIDPKEIGYTDYISSSDSGLTKILTLVYTWAGIVGVIVLIVAGFLFTTSRGDPAQMKRSKDAVRGAVIGLVVVAIAFVITRFVIGRVQ